jgi:hypothetical protein
VKHKFYVSPSSYGTDNIEDGVVAEGDDERDAVERYVEGHMADLDYPEDEVDMICRPVGGGPVTTWAVGLTSVTQAWAHPKDNKPLNALGCVPESDDSQDRLTPEE